MKKEKVRPDLKQEAFKRMEKLHPHQMMLFVGLVGSTIVFLFMMIAFAVSKPPAADFTRMQFPKFFMVSTVVMLLSSFSVSKIIPAFEKDDIDELKKWLGITFLLGLCFATCQFLGWRELQNSHILFSGDKSGAYLYVISGLHVVHVGAVLIYLLVLLMRCHKTSLDAVKQLVYATNPYEKVRFKILTDFWHFIDVLWLILFFYLLFSF